MLERRAKEFDESQYVSAPVDLSLLGKDMLIHILKDSSVPHSGGDSKAELKEKVMKLLEGQSLHFIAIKVGRDRQREEGLRAASAHNETIALDANPEAGPHGSAEASFSSLAPSRPRAQRPRNQVARPQSPQALRRPALKRTRAPQASHQRTGGRP